MDQLLQPDFWYAKTEALYSWFDREIFVGHSLLNLGAVAAGMLLARLFARPLKSKLYAAIERAT